MEKTHIAVLVGSLRKVSLNRQLAQAVMRLAPSNIEFELVAIGDLPLYDQDQDENQEASPVASACANERTRISSSAATSFGVRHRSRRSLRQKQPAKRERNRREETQRRVSFS